MSTSVKPDSKPWTVREQIVRDQLSGLTIQFEIDPTDGTPRLMVFGDALRFGPTEIRFNADGVANGGGGVWLRRKEPTWATPAVSVG